MSDSNYPFPPLPSASLTKDDVISHLVSIKSRGYEVYQDPSRDTTFIIILDAVHQIKLITQGNSKCQVQGIRYDFPHLGLYDVNSISQLQQAVDSIASKVVPSWCGRAKSGRLIAGAELQNFQTISNLIGSCSVEAVFDPYLDNNSLVMLKNILSFGDGKVASTIRLLGSTKTTGGQIPRFSKAGVDAWFIELGITGEARIMPPNDQHRRFLLLSGGQSLILGPSLNSIHKNEATHVEGDLEDKQFFNSVWASASPLS